jgi:hypothetical protein
MSLLAELTVDESRWTNSYQIPRLTGKCTRLELDSVVRPAQSSISAFSFTTSLKQQDSRDQDKHDSHEEHPRYRRDKSVSAIWTNTYVQS